MAVVGEGVRRLDLTKRVGRSAHLRYLLEPGAGWRPRDGYVDRRKHGKLFFNLQPTSWVLACRNAVQR